MKRLMMQASHSPSDPTPVVSGPPDDSPGPASLSNSPSPLLHGEHQSVLATISTLEHWLAEESQAVAAQVARPTSQAELLAAPAAAVDEIDPVPPAVALDGLVGRADRAYRLELVFESMREAIALLNSEGQILDCNAACEQLANQDRGALVGRHLLETLNWSFQDLSTIQQRIAAGAPWAGKVTVSDRAQADKSLWLTVTPAVFLDQPTLIVVFSDVSELTHNQRRLRRQALQDNVTGLANRRACRERLRIYVEAAEQAESRFAVCFLDLDNFKHVNDSLGHNAGDRLLEAIARILKQNIQPGCFVARFGGDEFAVLIPDISAELHKVEKITQDILAGIRRPIRIFDTEVYVSASIGVTVFPDHARDVDSLLRNADLAMYAAKDAGKNQVRIFSTKMQIDVEGRHRIQSRLRRALTGNELSLYYQPQTCAQTGQLIGCEALARWRTPSGDFIAPGDFIPVAEQSGLIVPLGEFVFYTACRQAQRWQSSAPGPPRIAVNVSPQQLRNPQFIQRFEAILAETGADPRRIEVEITENAVMDDVQQAIQIMRRLHELGVALAIDDFGTGHSSLSYLKSFPIDTLKIDASFVRDLVHDATAAAIISSIISLGKGRGLAVVAEGVETKAQLDQLNRMGCDVIQGYLVSPPLQVDAFEHWFTHYTASGP